MVHHNIFSTFKEPIILFTLQLLSPITLDIVGINEFSVLAQAFSYAASGFLSVVGGVYTFVKLRDYIKAKKKRGNRQTDNS